MIRRSTSYAAVLVFVAALFAIPLLLVIKMSVSRWPLMTGDQGINAPDNFEKAINHRLPRVTLPDFDYAARAQAPPLDQRPPRVHSSRGPRSPQAPRSAQGPRGPRRPQDPRGPQPRRSWGPPRRRS